MKNIIANQFYIDILTGGSLRDQAIERVLIGYRLIIEFDDNIIDFDTGFGGGGLVINISDERAIGGIETEGIAHVIIDGIGLNAEKAAHDPTISFKLGNNLSDLIDGNGKADAIGVGANHGINAHQLAT